MPTIFTQAGFRFMIYVHDHAPSHIHAHGQGGVVEVAINPVQLRAVRGNISDSTVRQVVRIAEDRREELLAAWRKHHGTH